MKWSVKTHCAWLANLLATSSLFSFTTRGNDMIELDEFTQAYIDCALWSTNDESTPGGGNPFDDNYDENDIDDDTFRTMITDCQQFQRQNAIDIIDENYLQESHHSIEEMAGHDFWLTRAGHGAGFWDGDWKDAAGQRLTKSSETFGEFNLELGDDGKIHGY